MSLDTEKQFAGNYIRLVNKSRSLEQEVILKERMIDLMALQLELFSCVNDADEWIKIFKTQALSELVAEQNKKAAEENISI